ncbi:MAG: phosphoenolpyruvate--protein phosphotransferase [Spirochaetaceae bacterium]|nr:MAG: phosphoenolpyruvate--protein phosphotransferase [Spirochaetaceae bacterium]
MIVYRGATASPGIASGTAARYEQPDLQFVPADPVSVEAEVQRLKNAASSAVNELTALQEAVRGRLGDDFAHIFRSQQTIAEDDAILAEVIEVISETSVSAETALTRVFDAYASMFNELADDDYNKSRGADIHDVYRRILRCLLGVPEISLSSMEPGSIVIAEDLLPSDTATMDTEHILALVTERGGPTSHVAILSRNLGIPAAVAVQGVLDGVQNGDDLVLDATDPGHAFLVVNPDDAKQSELLQRAETYRFRQERSAAYVGRQPVTVDGHEIEFSVNIGSTAELGPAREAGARSVGLYRSEFLFLNASRLPDEEEQFEAYRAAVKRFSDGYVVVRTLDIGGDKQIAGLPLPAEDNPFLGNRGLRLCLSRPDLFRTQIRAVLRASAFGDLRLMFPMVAGLNELDEAMQIISEERESLDSLGTAYNPTMQIGVMIEVPSAVLLADELAKRVDFFSIGTNDLTQYLLAADRLNERVARYYRKFDPAVFRAILQVVQAAHRHECWVGICGELGGDPRAVPALMGLGVDELSMSKGALAEATYAICTSDYGAAQGLADRVIRAETDAEIEGFLTDYYQGKE